MAAAESELQTRTAREDDEEEQIWAAIERLPTFERLRKGVLRRVMEDGEVVKTKELDIQKMEKTDRKVLVDRILTLVGNNHEEFLRRYRQRYDQMDVDIPKIEVRYEQLSVEGLVHVGNRAVPSLVNTSLDFAEAILGFIRLAPSKKKPLRILQNVSGIIRPSRMTLLLGPPSSGKTTLLSALAGRLDKELKVTGKITYCGHELNEFVPERTSLFVGQNDLHSPELTVRETLDFAAWCLGVGNRQQSLTKCLKLEKQACFRPDPDFDAFMKAIAIEGQQASPITDYVLKILGLDSCADTIVGDDMRRGISGGEKKRTTIGEMLVGPARAFFMDEISTGLDSSTAFYICNRLKEMVHILDTTMIVSLLQPTPETYELFDDVILLSEGQIVYQGPRCDILDFFGSMGFKCPERKGVADFLQEVTSQKEQRQYWSIEQPYKYVSISEFVQAFQSFQLGQTLASDLNIPYEKIKAHPNALVKENYNMSKWELLKTCFSRELLFMKRSYFLYIFKSFQIIFMALATMLAFFGTKMHHNTAADGQKYLGALFYSIANMIVSGMAENHLTVMRLPIFYKHRDARFFPAWAYALPIWLLQIPISFLESGLWTILTYYTIGYAPATARFFCQWLAYFCIHQTAQSLYRFFGAFGRTIVIGNTISMVFTMVMFVMGGFIIAKNDLAPWLMWAYYLSPMMYAQQALVINEFLAERWTIPNIDPRINEPTVGEVILASRGFFKNQYWFWISVGALLGFSILFNLLYILALTYLNPVVESKAMISRNDDEDMNKKLSLVTSFKGSTMGVSSNTQNPISSLVEYRRDVVEVTQHSNCITSNSTDHKMKTILPFQPLTLVFNHVNYYVDTPSEMKNLGYKEDRLQLLQNVSGAFRPGILTALVGVTGAGKTTLMDVLAGRKTTGYIDGNMTVCGYPKNQETFARVAGYCEQKDIHSPHVTVQESLIFSAWLRLPSKVNENTRKVFVEEVMELIELNQLKNSLVGRPGIDGLSTEQRKRLTMAVELVANPSIIFMDEPTSGLDARAAAIVMHTVRNTVNTGRTVVCTIHQPSIDIFEAFDELLLMKRGGQIIYAGPLGHRSHKLIEYFEAIPGVPKITKCCNPATWMLDVTSPQQEMQMGVDFTKYYENSSLYRLNQEAIANLSIPALNSKELDFPSEYFQPLLIQFKACFWKQYRSYWQNPSYNVVRLVMTTIMGVLIGVMFWGKGDKISNVQDLMNLIGVLFCALLFIGGSNALNVQALVDGERTVFYREKASRMYSAFPFALAQLSIEAIYLGVSALIYTILLFSMIGFEWTVGKFIYMFYFIFMYFSYYTLYGMMLLSLTPRHEFSAILMNFFINLWNLFAGFLLPRMQIPIWCRWYYWASPVAWTMYGIVTSQVGEKNTLLQVTEGIDMPINKFLEELFGYRHDFLPVVVVAHVCWILVFGFVFTFCIKFFNFQKR